MSHRVLVTAAVIASLPATLQGQQPSQATSGAASLSPTVETQELTSEVFENTRSLRILLPPGYHDPKNAEVKYPVLYLNDGVMAFHPPAIDVPGVFQKLYADGAIPPILVVGIDNGGTTDQTTNAVRDRANEYLPYPDAGFDTLRYAPDPPNPEGRRYPDFLIGEVMPLIERTYRVQTGPAHTAIGGFSYGGVAALYAVIRRPWTFGGLLLESTPLWIGPEKELLRDARASASWPATVYVGLGTLESPEEVTRAEGLLDRDALVAIIRQGSPATRLELVLEDGASHEPAAWRRRLPGAVVTLFTRR